ncbi:hypothetical protein ON010_g14299 [Phytophthora cinnamomi]|nr:hypothetical protein ON010_g14299 [Phytophthora cinnamomi]
MVQLKVVETGSTLPSRAGGWQAGPRRRQDEKKKGYTQEGNQIDNAGDGECKSKGVDASTAAAQRMEAKEVSVEARSCAESKETTVVDVRRRVGAAPATAADAGARWSVTVRKKGPRQGGTTVEETESSAASPTLVVKVVADMVASVA